MSQTLRPFDVAISYASVNRWVARDLYRLGTLFGYRVDALVGMGRDFNEAHSWLLENPWAINSRALWHRLTSQRQASPRATASLLHLLYRHSPKDMAKSNYLHESVLDEDDSIKVEVALVGLMQRGELAEAGSKNWPAVLSPGEKATLLQILPVLSDAVPPDLAKPGRPLGHYLSLLLDLCTQMIQEKVSR